MSKVSLLKKAATKATDFFKVGSKASSVAKGSTLAKTATSTLSSAAKTAKSLAPSVKTTKTVAKYGTYGGLAVGTGYLGGISLSSLGAGLGDVRRNIFGANDYEMTQAKTAETLATTDLVNALNSGIGSGTFDGSTGSPFFASGSGFDISNYIPIIAVVGGVAVVYWVMKNNKKGGRK